MLLASLAWLAMAFAAGGDRRVVARTPGKSHDKHHRVSSLQARHFIRSVRSLHARKILAHRMHYLQKAGAAHDDGRRGRNGQAGVESPGMVERIRQSKLYGFLAAICLEFLAMFVHSAQDDEIPDEESVTAIHEKQPGEIAPPPPPRVFEPMMQFDPSPWFDEAGEMGWEIATA